MGGCSKTFCLGMEKWRKNHKFEEDGVKCEIIVKRRALSPILELKRNLSKNNTHADE